MKKLSALIILSVTTATPVFAQDPDLIHRGRAHQTRNELNALFHASSRTQRGFTADIWGPGERDPSRVGAGDAELHPSSS